MCKNYENISIMAHGLHAMIKSEIGCNGSSSGKPRPGGGSSSAGAAGKMGSRRIFTPQFKLQVLDSYRNDSDCKGNQRATARKYGIHRRQIQKWLQVENNLRSAAANSANGGGSSGSAAMKINLLSNSGNHHPPQFQLHPQLHHHHHHIAHHQNLNSIELKVPMDSTRHRVAPNASNNNNNINGKESSACIISPVPTHTVPTGAPPPSSFPHPHETSSSSASLSILNAPRLAAGQQQVPRPNFSPVSGVEHPVAERLHLLDQYYHHYARFAIDSATTSPIDLSLPQHFRGGKVEQQAMSPCSTASSVYSSRPRSATPPAHESEKVATDCDSAVDLSCRKRKSSGDDDASPPKSVKLFKPYLLDEKEEDKDEKDSQIDSPAPKEVGRHDYPIIWNFHAQQRYYESLCGAGSEFGYGYPPSPPYPLTPIPRTPFSSTLSPSPPTTSTTSWAPPQASPVSGYDSSTSISSVYSQDGNDDGGAGYSFELKQQAIDSYYHDVSCRGDFRAVASKFNIQRKYVEKWLAQEDHLGSSKPPPKVVFAIQTL